MKLSSILILVENQGKDILSEEMLLEALKTGKMILVPLLKKEYDGLFHGDKKSFKRVINDNPTDIGFTKDQTTAINIATKLQLQSGGETVYICVVDTSYLKKEFVKKNEFPNFIPSKKVYSGPIPRDAFRYIRSAV